jgi:hypothetical protein
MRKFLILTTVVFLAALLLHGQAAAGTGPTASLSFPVLPSLPLNLRTTPTQFLWDYDFTQPNSRACINTITTGCVNGFTVQVVNQTTNAVVSGPTTVGLIVAVSTTGPTIGFSVPFTAPATLGSYAIQVTVNWQ